MDWLRYNSLSSAKEKAAYLLTRKITAQLNILGFELVMQARIDDVWLPVTGESEDETIHKARAWLRGKAGLCADGV